jgi:hypothetical protein
MPQRLAVTPVCDKSTSCVLQHVSEIPTSCCPAPREGNCKSGPATDATIKPREDLGLEKLNTPNASNAGSNNRSRAPEFLDFD